MFRLCVLLTSCMKLYISVLLGLGCSQSFLGTERESIVGSEDENWKQEQKIKGRYEENSKDKQKQGRSTEDYSYAPAIAENAGGERSPSARDPESAESDRFRPGSGMWDKKKRGLEQVRESLRYADQRSER